MVPKNLKRFLSTVQKSSFREYLAGDTNAPLSKVLEDKLRWAGENEDATRQDEADFLINNRANLRSMAATMPLEEDEEWVESASVGPAHEGKALSNPYMAFNMFSDEDEDEDGDGDDSDEETLRLENEDTSDEPTPLPGSIGFSRAADGESPEPEPEPPVEDGPQIGAVAAYQNVSKRNESSYEMATGEPTAVPDAPVVNRKLRAQKQPDGRHILSGLRAAERLTAARFIPETVSKLRPYLLAALLLALLPLAYLIGDPIESQTANESGSPEKLAQIDPIVVPPEPNTATPDDGSVDEFIDIFGSPNPEDIEGTERVPTEENPATDDKKQPQTETVNDTNTDQPVEKTSTEVDTLFQEKKDTATKPTKSPEQLAAAKLAKDQRAAKKVEAAALEKQKQAAKKAAVEKAAAEKAAAEKLASQTTLIVGGSATGPNSGSSVPDLSGSWKGKLGGQTCVLKLKDQVETSMKGELKCISASSGENYNMLLKGRYNLAKGTLYLQEIGGLGGWIRANLDDNVMWGNSSPYSGALKQSFKFTR